MEVESNDIYRAMNEFVRAKVWSGFYSKDEILDMVVDEYRNSDATYSDYGLRKLADDMYDVWESIHNDAQKEWIEDTDTDKLDDAFAELDRNGIIARQNFTCCQTCGHTEINIEIENAVHDEMDVRGYTFFHQQDTDHVVDNEILYLAYGSYDGREEDSVKIGHEVVRTLERHGLNVSWSGMIQKRIKIEMKWKRRKSNWDY